MIDFDNIENDLPQAFPHAKEFRIDGPAKHRDRRFLKIITNILFAICLLVLAGAITLSAIARQNNTAISVAGYQSYAIATASMEPILAVGGMAVTHDDDFAKVKIGDIVSFQAEGLSGQTALHRVIAKTDSGGLVVKGDNNPHPDGALVTKENYLGRVVYNTNLTATFFNTINRPGGIFLAIVLPLVVLILIYLAVRWIIGSTKDWRSKSLGICLIAMLISGSLFASYTLSTIKRIDTANSGLATIAQDFAKSDREKNWTIEGKDVLGVIEIPKIDIVYPIITYVSATSLDLSITHFSGAKLNESGNTVLAGHRAFGRLSPFNLFFTNTDKLVVGDTIYITDKMRQRQAYRVTGYKIVEPSDTSILDQPTDGAKNLTLISCSYDLLNRYIVSAIAE